MSAATTNSCAFSTVISMSPVGWREGGSGGKEGVYGGKEGGGEWKEGVCGGKEGGSEWKEGINGGKEGINGGKKR